ncbi:MAG: class B sortase [Ruminococcus sp.]|nr:class B sortase [Ruminococcus sp.]
MSYQNNHFHPNHPDPDDSGYQGKRFRNDDHSVYDEAERDNFDVSNEPQYQNHPSYPQNDDDRPDYGSQSRQPYPQRRYGQQSYGSARGQYPPQSDGYHDSYDVSSGYGRHPQRRYDDNYQNYYQNDSRGRKPKRRTGTAIIVVRVIAVIMLLVGGYIIGAKLYSYYIDNKGHSSLQALSQDFDQLYAMNNDFFGWLKIDDTVIDYPVMHTPYDSERYLHMDFEGEYSESGELFMDADCDPYGMHYLIYGHHMFNGSMFGSLPKYEDQDYYSEHRTLRFDTLYEMGEYEIFAVFYSRIYDESEDVFKYYNCANLNDEWTYNYYVENVKALSVYDTGVTPQYGEKIVTLSTCNYHTDDGRFVVAARKIQ